MLALDPNAIVNWEKAVSPLSSSAFSSSNLSRVSLSSPDNKLFTYSLVAY
jgi:hypothetical protein